MSKFSYAFPAVLVVIIAIGIAVWSFLKVSNNPVNPTIPVSKNVTTKDLPINLPDKSVESVSITYAVIGALTEIKKTPQGEELITDIKTPNLPRFIIAPDKTQFWDTSKKPAEKLVGGASLSPGQKVRIIINYFPAAKLWGTLSAVMILSNK